MTPGNSIRTREQRARRAAKRQGLALRKSRTRDPRALDYGKWVVTDRQGVGHDLPYLAAVERYLEGER